MAAVRIGGTDPEHSMVGIVVGASLVRIVVVEQIRNEIHMYL